MTNTNRTKVRRETTKTMPTTLPLGELMFCTDTNELYVGRGSDTPINKVIDPEVIQKQKELTSQLESKASKTEVFLKQNGININDFDEATRKTFLEAQGIDVNYVLGSDNVKEDNISVEYIEKVYNLAYEKLQNVNTELTLTSANMVQLTEITREYSKYKLALRLTPLANGTNDNHQAIIRVADFNGTYLSINTVFTIPNDSRLNEDIFVFCDIDCSTFTGNKIRVGISPFGNLNSKYIIKEVLLCKNENLDRKLMHDTICLFGNKKIYSLPKIPFSLMQRSEIESIKDNFNSEVNNITDEKLNVSFVDKFENTIYDYCSKFENDITVSSSVINLAEIPTENFTTKNGYFFGKFEVITSNVNKLRVCFVDYKNGSYNIIKEIYVSPTLNVGDVVNIKQYFDISEFNGGKVLITINTNTGFNGVVRFSNYGVISENEDIQEFINLYGNIKTFPKLKTGVDVEKITDIVAEKINELPSLGYILRQNTFKNKKWNVVGDSITANKEHYYRVVSENLGMIATGLGISGSTLAVNNNFLTNKSMVERVCGLNGVTAYTDSDIWTIYGGINDAVYSSTLGTFNNKDSSTVYGALRLMCENIIQRPNKPKLILITPHRIWNSEHIGTLPLLKSIRNAMVEVAEFYAIPYIDLFNKSGFTHINNSIVTTDGTHPSEAGSLLLEETITRELLGLC